MKTNKIEISITEYIDDILYVYNYGDYALYNVLLRIMRKLGRVDFIDIVKSAYKHNKSDDLMFMDDTLEEYPITAIYMPIGATKAINIEYFKGDVQDEKAFGHEENYVELNASNCSEETIEHILCKLKRYLNKTSK